MNRELIYGLHVVPVSTSFVSVSFYDKAVDLREKDRRYFVCYTQTGMPKLIYHSNEGYILLEVEEEKQDVYDGAGRSSNIVSIFKERT